MKTIDAVMTQSPVTITGDTPLTQVASLMEREDTGFLPVCENNQLLGVITDRDIVIRAVAKGINLETAKARDFLTQTLVCVTPQQDVKDAVHLMAEHKVRRLCVVEAQGSKNLVGVVSLGDLAEVPDSRGLSEEALQEISKSLKTLAHAR